MTTPRQRLARVALDAMETRKRESGEESVTFSDVAPDWTHDLARDAHIDSISDVTAAPVFGMLPDDWRYVFIRDSLSIIVENDDEDDWTEAVDSSVSVYNADLLSWLSSHIGRPGYVDDAVEECGHAEIGIMGDIMRGQFAEREEVLHLVAEFLDELVDAEPDEEIARIVRVLSEEEDEEGSTLP